MPPRRSHQKSRRGCVQCKNAHIKCSEDGPPCGRCKTRSMTCEYASPAPSSSGGVRDQATPHDPVVSSTHRSNSVATPMEAFFPADPRLLELQLMHRWSTHTYQSMSTPASDDWDVWQYQVPALAMKYDFLLSGVLALTAFEAAARTTAANRERYINAAVKYHSLTLEQGASALASQASHGNSIEVKDSRICFSLIVMVLTLASAQFTRPRTIQRSVPGDLEEGTMFQYTLIHYELICGCEAVLGTHEEMLEYIAQNPHLSKLTSFEDLHATALSPEVQDILEKLSSLNERRLVTTVAESYEIRTRHAANFEACKTAIAFLRELFAKCSDVAAGEDYSYQGYVLGFLNMAGKPYVLALKQDDEVALSLLMFWGALVERLSWRVWWAKDYGGQLVDEIESRLEHRTKAEDVELVRDIILAAKTMINTSAKS